MLSAPFVLTALVVALVLGGLVSAYLWLIVRPRLAVTTGIHTLAAMRWREFSRFVIEALHAQGFEASRADTGSDKGSQQGDLLLNRGDQTWLLSCKQGANYRITSQHVDDLARAVRQADANGGILATLGRFDASARAHNPDIELMDGPALWALIEPLLPPSLHLDLAARARRQALRAIQVTWVAALLAGIALTPLLLPITGALPGDDAPANLVVADGTAAAKATVQATDEAATLPEPPPDAPVPASESEQREEVAQVIATLPGFTSAVWSTRSTLLVYLLDDDADAREVAALCTTLRRYDALRASRVQLQPPAGSERPVRFMQCQAY